MGKNLVITIGREFGSGGREIAKKLSSELNIKMYDKELISLTAKQSGYNEDILHDIDETATNSFLYALSTGVYPHPIAFSAANHTPLNQRAFLVCSEVIRGLAEKESCIIVGRCADSILKDHENLLRVFIYADEEKRIDRISEYEKISRSKASAILKKEDRKRAAYHNYYADTKWGSAKGYDLCINSSIGIEKAVELIKHAALGK